MKELSHKKILIINPFGIGDVLFTFPVIRAIKEKGEDIFVGFWCNERVEPILKNNPYIDKIFAMSKGDIKKIYSKSKIKGMVESLKLLSSIRKEHFDMSFDVSLDYRYNLISQLAGIKRRVGFNYKNRGRFLTERIDIDGFNGKHVVEYYLDALKLFNIEVKNKPMMELFLSKEDTDWADNFLKGFKVTDNDLLIGIAPAGGLSWGGSAFYLRWSEEKFAYLCQALINKYNAKIILFGSFDEIGICKNIESSLIESSLKGNIINTAGVLTLAQFAALLKKCKIAICNDAGPLHVAVALGLKTVCICGPVDEKVYGPYPNNENTRIVKAGLSCQPCYQRFKMSNCQDKKCLEDLEVDAVFEKVRELL
ncbi:MAG: glycosyltransferase family 9 protein [Candidatus Omnitrophota bacterium]|nr:glycosyltransferase family 9 protein [Candidatus Omnitrophota bacterium]